MQQMHTEIDGAAVGVAGAVMDSVDHGQERSKQESSFLKKRSKRLLFRRPRQDPGHGLDLGSGGELKVFWFFSSEKNTFPGGSKRREGTPHPNPPHKGEGEVDTVMRGRL
jgi:hypothetical protein